MYSVELFLALVGAGAAALFGAVGYWLRVLIDRRHQGEIEEEKARAVARAREEIEQEYAGQLREREARIDLARQRYLDRYESIEGLRFASVNLNHEVDKALGSMAFYNIRDDLDNLLGNFRERARVAKGLEPDEAELLWGAIRHLTDVMGAFFDAARQVGLLWNLRLLPEATAEEQWAAVAALESVIMRLVEVGDAFGLPDFAWGWGEAAEEPLVDPQPMDVIDQRKFLRIGSAIRDGYRIELNMAGATAGAAMEQILARRPF